MRISTYDCPVDSIVVTPSGRKARVTGHDSDGRLHIVYVDGKPPYKEEGTIWPKLLLEAY